MSQEFSSARRFWGEEENGCSAKSSPKPQGFRGFKRGRLFGRFGMFLEVFRLAQKAGARDSLSRRGYGQWF
jgi:hypothetical protein